MKGIFWNARGIGKDPKKRFVREMIMEHNLDFVGILETIKQNFTKGELHNLCNGKNYEWKWNPPRGLSGGILVGVNRDHFDVILAKQEEYFLSVMVYDKNAKFHWNLIAVYGDAQPEKKSWFFG